MLGRTHKVGALAAVGVLVANRPDVAPADAPTVVLALAAALLGAAAPDLDQMRGLAGKLVGPFCLGHRKLSHSLLGLGLFAVGFGLGLGWLAGYLPLPIDPPAVTGAFVIGMASHLLLDALTPLGIPILWPLPIKLAMPLRALRVPTGGLVERYTVLPGLTLAALWHLWLLAGPSLIRFVHLAAGIDAP